MTMQTQSAPRRRTVLAMVAGAIGLAAAAGPARAAPGDLVDLQVVDRETGQALQVWRHAGRTFVAGEPNARYAVRIRNTSAGRVLVVVSVDGLNILTGETAAYGQTGYVLAPYETYDVSGWRKSNTEVAAFTFAPQAQSYAARTGRAADIGVIGVAAFREKVYAPPPAISRISPGTELDETVVTGARRAPPRAAAVPPLPVPPVEHRIEEPRPPASARADAAAALAERQPDKLGTAHGAREWSVVSSVAFERATPYPQMIRRIEYDSYERLVASGVIPPARPWERPPRAFPGSDGSRYVPDPPGGR